MTSYKRPVPDCDDDDHCGELVWGRAEAHEESDQVLLILEGELIGKVGEEHLSLRKDEVIVIPAGVKHRFTNRSRRRTVTFNVYSPPAYPAG